MLTVDRRDDRRPAHRVHLVGDVEVPLGEQTVDEGPRHRAGHRRPLGEPRAGRREPETAFFTFFTRIVADAGSKKALTDALRHAGVDVKEGQEDQRGRMRATLQRLLRDGQAAGVIREDVGMPEVLALLRGASMAAETGDYPESTLDRSLTVLFDGLRSRRTGISS
ncbi:SbtR family transcriptional regulator [Actinoplanes octamycinicus]